MFSQTTEYALRAIVWLADHPDAPLTTQQIAEGTQVPTGYLSKVMQNLGREGLVTAQRGKHGGFALARGTHRITVLEVINSVDPIRRIRKCPLGLKSHAHGLCSLHRRMDDAMDLVERTLGGTTIAELLEGPAPSRPLCSIVPLVRHA